MFFVLSKLLDVAVDPLWWGAGLVLVGVVLLARDKRRRLGVGLSSAGLGVLLLFSLPAVANRLFSSLEAGATSTFQPGVTYDAVVLLGGAVSPLGSERDAPAWNDNVERLLETHRLLTTGQARVAIVSGGSLGGALRTEAEYLAAELRRLGVPAEQVIIEDQANNTRENATESKKHLERLGAKKVLLVTSAFHLPRSVGCFRAVGIEADTLPVDFRMRRPGADRHVAPRAEYLGESAKALREWLGRLVYRAMGYTKE
jgi:uncharacterized SAM-binding protein YcdF (DUF218 family)